MKKRFTVFYAVFAAIFMLFSLGYCGYNLYKEYKQGDARSASIFANTVYRLYSDLEHIDDNTANNYQQVVHAAGDLADYSFYEVKRGSEIIYSYPLGSTQEATSSNFTKRYTSEITLENKSAFTVDCNIFLLRPYSIYYYSRVAFFMILGITLLTVIIIIVSNKQTKTIDNSDSNEEEEIDEDYELEEKVIETKNVVESEKQDSPVKLSENETPKPKEEENIENIEVTYEREADNDDTTIVEDYKTEETKNNSDTSTKIENENVVVEPAKTEPEGLFSTSSGLGWESYLMTRLENEINRAISSEMDISIFVIKLTNMERNSDLSIKVCNYLAEQFKFRDLLFEYKDDCIVAIENGADLDAALSLADKLHDDITVILKGTESKCFMGISTRSIRMISAQRFLKEADEALLHAQEDESSPIIAFRADVEKYRKYMEQNFQD